MLFIVQKKYSTTCWTFYTLLMWVAFVSPAMDTENADGEQKVLYIGGIFPVNGTSGWQGGQVCN